MGKIMNITIIANRLSGRGGEETVLGSILTNKLFMKDNNIRVYWIQTNPNINWISNFKIDPSIFIINSHTSKAMKLVSFFNDILKNNSELIICMDIQISYILKIIKTVFGKKYLIVLWPHFSIMNAPHFKKAIKLIKHSDYYLAISKGIKRELVRSGVPSDKIKVIYNPIKKNDLIIAPSNDGIYRIIYVGRIMLDGQKNLRELFNALCDLPFDWELNIYGDGIDLNRCKDYCKSIGIISNIRWHGWVNNPWRKIKNADCLILCSKYEGFPMVLGEAISRGIPCISSDCPDGPEDIILNGKNGFLYKSGDTNSLRKSIIKMHNDPSINRNIVKDSLNKYRMDNYIINLQRVLNTFH